MAQLNPMLINGVHPGISSQAVKAAISYFGISESFSDDGHKTWVIDLASEDPSLPGLPNKAIYDDAAKCWRPTNEVLRTRPRSGSQPSPAISAASSGGTVPKRNDCHDLNTLICQHWLGFLPDTDHVDFFRAVDWSLTPLGDLKSWSRALRLYTHMMFSDQRPAAIYWGKDRVALYNELFIPLIGSTHPRFMGSAFQAIWPEIWDSFNALFLQMESTGIGVTLDDYCLFVQRNDYIEETWWIGDLFPLKNDLGEFGGCYVTWKEATRQVLQDRRTKLINDIGDHSGLQNVDDKAVWTHVHKTFTNNPRDISMAIMYSIEEATQDGKQLLHLEGAIGPNTRYTAAPPLLEIDDEKCFAPLLREAQASEADWLARKSSLLPPEVLENLDWQGFGEASEMIVVIPLIVMNDLLKGFLIIGLNPRRLFDSDHQQFISDLSRSLKAVMTSVTTTEQARRREAQLSKELADSERRIRRMAELAPMGMYDISATGDVLWANSHFHDLVGTSGDLKELANFSFAKLVYEEDLERAMGDFVKCLQEKKEISHAIRINRTWRPPRSPHALEEPKDEPAWILSQAYPYVENGEVKSVMGCMSNISQFKWAESVQARMAEAAQRAKRMQEEFIDITSHEMRNPLSAVMQCADGILASVEEYHKFPASPETTLQILQSNVEAAESILLCASHQKRVIDDVLTLSKLDSDLLPVTPAAFQVNSVISEATQMFKAEFASNDIDFDARPDERGKLGLDQLVFCDPARLLQVLINLLSNAIKFTRTEETRRVSIRYGGSEIPLDATEFGPYFSYSVTKKTRKDLTADPDYGQGAPVYLFFAVEDTGQGLRSEEAVLIFDKFTQASRRTHIKYGGSGLGLFISRELTEMQGGKIGVSSAEGVGSTFAFYVKARKAMGLSLPSKPRRESQRAAGDAFKRADLLLRQPSLPETVTTTVQATQAVDLVPSSPTAAPPPPQQLLPQPRPARAYSLLIVEDNLVNQTVLAKQLRKAGCTVHLANHGGEAVDFVRHVHGLGPEYGTRFDRADLPPPAPVDCVLMDLEMPVCSGLTATLRIRQLERQGILARRQVVVAITANARHEQVQTAMEAGVDGVVPKPFRLPQLMAKIGALVGEDDLGSRGQVE